MRVLGLLLGVVGALLIGVTLWTRGTTGDWALGPAGIGVLVITVGFVVLGRARKQDELAEKQDEQNALLRRQVELLERQQAAPDPDEGS